MATAYDRTAFDRATDAIYEGYAYANRFIAVMQAKARRLLNGF